MLVTHLKSLPKFCRGAILTTASRSLGFEMINLAVQLMNANNPTTPRGFENERRDIEICHIERSLDELKEIRAAFADITPYVSPNARVEFDELIDDKLRTSNRDKEITVFHSLNTGLTESEIREIFRDYDARHLSHDTKATVLDILWRYKVYRYSIDKSFCSATIDVRRNILKVLNRALKNRHESLSYENVNPPLWVIRMKAIEQFKELKCIAKCIDGLQNVYSDISAS